MITYFKNQIEMAESLKLKIDKYWNMGIDEDDLIKYIKQVNENNFELMFKNNDYTMAVKQKLGTKRLRLINKILERQL
ncbi:MAG: TIGR04540 family protein [Gudongella sp.]|nr:TIGR04540 family protein [Gudongella sp.]